jgi:hypothetical protein
VLLHGIFVSSDQAAQPYDFVYAGAVANMRSRLPRMEVHIPTNEREMTAQAAATGGDTIPQHGHGEHEEESDGIVVLQWRAGKHGACMGNSRAQGGARRGNLYGHSRRIVGKAES